ncbi:hypothetical protein ACFLZH_04470 [Patescibacteria group bacterium]
MKVKFIKSNPERSEEAHEEIVAPKLSGVVKEFKGPHYGMAVPYHLLQLEGDDRKFMVHNVGALELQPGTPVTLHSFRGFEKEQNQWFQICALEINDETGQTLAIIRNHLSAVFDFEEDGQDTQ